MILDVSFVNIVLFLAGVGVLGYALYGFVKSYELVKNSEFSTGTVIRLVRERSQTRGYYYYYSAIIHFETSKGRRVKFKLKPLMISNGTCWPTFQEGQIFSIRYHAKAPRTAVIETPLHWYLWYQPVLYTVIGITLLVFAIGCAYGEMMRGTS